MYQTHSRMPPPPPLGPQRRNPLTNAVNGLVNTNNHMNNNNQHQYYRQPPTHDVPKPSPVATVPALPEKAPGSPPLPRQNPKTAPPSPPKLIIDKTGRFQFQRVGFLGEGGFARVYEVKDPKGQRQACKVVTKDSLKTKKAKTKLYAEIKIHRSLEHPNIVRFHDCFEDEANVYMSLELCPSGSLMDLLRRRRRFSEPEARFFMVQLIGACHYMHRHQVIHRDLKLGNLFLDGNMNVKVGDFGLAALIENPGERKKTICGTPNYIAPEVLFDTANGHSFEVDTWSIGVILYTFVVGRPPFQTKDVKAIYKRIRDNEYEFPTERAISTAAQILIQQILTPDPQLRPTLHEILEHAFFTQGLVPAYIPTSAHDGTPDFRHITRPVSESNLRRLRRYALLDDDQQTSSPAEKANAMAQQQGGKSITSIANSVAQQEKEFQKAVQPGSPISALLSSARQPLLMGSSNPAAVNGGGGARESPLLRKLQAVKESPLRRNVVTARGLEEQQRGLGEEDEEELRVRKKELEAQKARIVAQMAPVREEEEQDDDADDVEMAHAVQAPVYKAQRVRERGAAAHLDRENIPPAAAAVVTKKEFMRSKEVERPRDVNRVLGRAKENVPLGASTTSTTSTTTTTTMPTSNPSVKLNSFDAAAQVLSLAFDAKAAGKVFRNPDSHIPLPEERVFIVSWVDYCNKYGMGYALTDGSVGVHFNDSTTCVLSPDKIHFDYISARRQGAVYMRKSHTVDSYPDDLKSKVYLLKHFERYIMDRLYGEYNYTFEDVERQKGMEWVQKYLRMKHVIVFKLSHDVLQFNFYDHSKLILSSHGLMVTHIDKHYKMTRWTLTDIMVKSLAPRSADADPDQVKFNQRLVEKLKYCKEVLVSIRTASANGSEVPEESEAMGAALAMPPTAIGGLGSKASKASLR